MMAIQDLLEMVETHHLMELLLMVVDMVKVILVTHQVKLLAVVLEEAVLGNLDKAYIQVKDTEEDLVHQ